MGHEQIKSHCDGDQKSYTTLYDIFKIGTEDIFDDNGKFVYLNKLDKSDIIMDATFKNSEELNNIQVVGESSCIVKNTEITNQGNTSKIEIGFDTKENKCDKSEVEKLFTNPDSFKIMLNSDLQKVDCKGQLSEHSKYAELESYVSVQHDGYAYNNYLDGNNSIYVYNCDCSLV